MLDEGLGGFILSPFQAVPSEYSRSKEKTTSIFALYGDDLNLVGVGVGF
jgi:hypothetical protein